VIAPRCEAFDLDQPLFLQSQPGEQIRIVFPVGEQHRIAGLKGKAQGHRVDGMGRVQGKEDFFCRARMDEFGDELPGSLDAVAGISVDAIGHLFGKPVVASSAAAGGIVRVVLVHGRDDRPRHQRRAGIVQIEGRLPVPLSFQRRKIVPASFYGFPIFHEFHLIGLLA
jgi:hypothetical protein